LSTLVLSFNGLFGPIPVTLARAPLLKTLDIRNNSLSGNVPPGKMVSSTIAYPNVCFLLLAC
jgi:hypothetical protein